MVKKFFLPVIFFFLSFNLYSQEDTSIYKTEEIIVYGNKLLHSIFYSPVDVKIFTKDDIKNLNGGKLYDIINYCGGIHLKSYSGINSLKTISFNGLGAEHTAVLLNGIKLNSQQNSQVDLSLIPVENVERVEILSGGFGSLYGSDASGGVVNIKTEEFNFYKDKKYNFNWLINSAAGSYGYYYFGVSTFLKNNNSSLNIGYSKEKSNNNYDFFFHNGLNIEKRQRENASFSGNKFYLNSDIKLLKDFRLKYFGYYYILDRNLPQDLNSIFSLNEKQKDRSFVNIFQTEYKNKNEFTLKTQFGYQENIINYEAGTIFNDYYRNRNYVLQAEGAKMTNKINLYAGAEVNYNTFESSTIKDISRTLTGVFLTGELNFINNFKIYPSLRYETASDVNYKKLYSKLGINFKPFDDENFHLRASISNNGRIPAFNDLYWVPGGNPNLKPESAINFDFGVIYGFELFGNNIIDISYKNILMNDKITWVYNNNIGLWNPVNIGKSRSDIFSFDLKSQIYINKNILLSINTNYTYNLAKKTNEDFQGDLSFNKQIPYVPVDLLKFNLSLNYKDAGINLFYNLIGKRYADAENNNSLSPAGILDANIYYNFIFGYLKLRLTMEINNITNTDYSIMPGYPMPLRNYIAKVSLFN